MEAAVSRVGGNANGSGPDYLTGDMVEQDYHSLLLDQQMLR